MLRDRPAWQPPELPMLVIALHPDDETLGAGGLIAHQRRRGVPVRMVAVTDGEAAHCDLPQLGDVRRQEQESAFRELGGEPQSVIRLQLPDGAVSGNEQELIERVRPLVGPTTLLVAPWSFDPHPDHEALRTRSAIFGGILWRIAGLVFLLDVASLCGGAGLPAAPGSISSGGADSRLPRRRIDSSPFSTGMAARRADFAGLAAQTGPTRI